MPKSSHSILAPWTRVAAATILGASSFYIYKLLSKHGFDGLLRLVWEGSPYPPGLREPHEAIDGAGSAAQSLEDTIRTLEVALDDAQLAEESNFSSILQQWQKNAQPITEDLRQQLSVLSYDLDLLAARVDAILSEDDFVKQRKKDMSLRVVELMERADALISFFTKASSPVI